MNSKLLAYRNAKRRARRTATAAQASPPIEHSSTPSQPLSEPIASAPASAISAPPASARVVRIPQVTLLHTASSSSSVSAGHASSHSQLPPASASIQPHEPSRAVATEHKHVLPHAPMGVMHPSDSASLTSFVAADEARRPPSPARSPVPLVLRPSLRLLPTTIHSAAAYTAHDPDPVPTDTTEQSSSASAAFSHLMEVSASTGASSHAPAATASQLTAAAPLPLAFPLSARGLRSVPPSHPLGNTQTHSSARAYRESMQHRVLRVLPATASAAFPHRSQQHHQHPHSEPEVAPATVFPPISPTSSAQAGAASLISSLLRLAEPPSLDAPHPDGSSTAGSDSHSDSGSASDSDHNAQTLDSHTADSEQLPSAAQPLPALPHQFYRTSRWQPKRKRKARRKRRATAEAEAPPPTGTCVRPPVHPSITSLCSLCAVGTVTNVVVFDAGDVCHFVSFIELLSSARLEVQLSELAAQLTAPTAQQLTSLDRIKERKVARKRAAAKGTPSSALRCRFDWLMLER